jgi:hypothetical protein
LGRLHGHHLLALATLVGEQRERAVLDVALAVEGDRTGHALVVDLGELGQVLLRVGRVGLLHRRDHRHRRVVHIRRVELDVHAELALEPRPEVLHRLDALALDAAGFGANDLAIGHAFARELDQLGRADSVATHELRVDAELLHLAQHRARDRVHATVEDQVRLGALELGQDRVEVGRLVIGVFAAHHLATGRLDRLLELVGHALSVGGAVVDDRERLGLDLLDRVAAERAAELAVVSDDAERGLEALLRVLRVRRRR